MKFSDRFIEMLARRQGFWSFPVAVDRKHVPLAALPGANRLYRLDFITP